MAAAVAATAAAEALIRGGSRAVDLQSVGIALWELYGPFMVRQETPAWAICCRGHFSPSLPATPFAFVSLAERGGP